MTEPDKIDLLMPYERLACYRCRELKVTEDKRFVWCDLDQDEFPLMCNQYRGLHG